MHAWQAIITVERRLIAIPSIPPRLTIVHEKLDASAKHNEIFAGAMTISGPIHVYITVDIIYSFNINYGFLDS